MIVLLFFAVLFLPAKGQSSPEDSRVATNLISTSETARVYENAEEDSRVATNLISASKTQVLYKQEKRHPTISLNKKLYSALNSKPILLSYNQKTNSFNPFIDYQEFEDNVTEQKDINFFQNGRALNINLLLGYEAITFNMRQLYGDSPTALGFSVGFFFDLNFALYIGGLLPHSHYSSLFGTTPAFSTIHTDFKYYLNKQHLIKSAAKWLNPYLVFGPFWLSIGKHNINDVQSQPSPINTNLQGPTPQEGNPASSATPVLDAAVLGGNFTAFGFKLGAGLEIPFVKQTYIGLEVSYLYTNLDQENKDLSTSRIQVTRNNPNKTFFDRLIFPDTPQVKGYRFYGDMLTALFVFGVNF